MLFTAGRWTDHAGLAGPLARSGATTGWAGIIVESGVAVPVFDLDGRGGDGLGAASEKVGRKRLNRDASSLNWVFEVGRFSVCVDGAVAEYAGGGGSSGGRSVAMDAAGRVLVRWGNRGGMGGCDLEGIAGGGDRADCGGNGGGVFDSALRVGGFGRLRVSSPVVSRWKGAAAIRGADSEVEDRDGGRGRSLDKERPAVFVFGGGPNLSAAEVSISFALPLPKLG